MCRNMRASSVWGDLPWPTLETCLSWVDSGFDSSWFLSLWSVCIPLEEVRISSAGPSAGAVLCGCLLTESPGFVSGEAPRLSPAPRLCSVRWQGELSNLVTLVVLSPLAGRKKTFKNPFSLCCSCYLLFAVLKFKQQQKIIKKKKVHVLMWPWGMLWLLALALGDSAAKPHSF